MSYLHLPRLTFSGRFQADPSTVNNDPRHYDNETFTPRFQQFGTASTNNGWWNPTGTSIFRFSDCTVQQAVGPSGVATPDAVVGCLVGNSPDRPSAKLVDLDPDWQLASHLYGLAVSIIDPATGRLALLADFEPAPFRDLSFARSGGSAIWQSQLTNLRWNLDALKSPVMQALAEGSKHFGRLSIGFTTYSCMLDATKPDFTYGTLVGAIGLAFPEEPKSFIAGRRFMPNGAFDTPPATNAAANSMLCFNAKVIDDTLVADFSNALPLDGNGNPVPLGGLQFAMLHDTEMNEGAAILPSQYTPLGPVDVTVSSFIQTLAIPPMIRSLIEQRPLALVAPGSNGQPDVVMMREVPHGRDLRADVFSFRLDPNDRELNRQVVPLYATRYGLPLADAPIGFVPFAPAPDTGNSVADQTLGTTPTATIPMTNCPNADLHIEPSLVRTDAAGRASVTFSGPAHMGAPRRYLDGQLYAVAYNFADAQPTIMQAYDQISVLLFSSFSTSVKPTWEEIQPIWQQYANLYPIMSQGLFDFSKKADANAYLLYFVLSKPITDPDHMPVTRDLSAGKRRALLAYLESVMPRSAVHTPDTAVRYSSRCPFSGVTSAAPHESVPNPTSKQPRSR
jgi:hypothetical protein